MLRRAVSLSARPLVKLSAPARSALAAHSPACHRGNFPSSARLLHLHSKGFHCGLTRRLTGPIAAGRHLGYKSLAQTPARRNRPVSLYVRHHPENATNFINSARRDASPHKNGTQFDLLAKHIRVRAFRARQYIFHQTVLSHCNHTIRSAA